MYPEQYDVEKIEGHRTTGNTVEYLVKWRGYASSKNTWEPEIHLAGNIVLKNYRDGIQVATPPVVVWESALDDYSRYIRSQGLSTGTVKSYRNALHRCWKGLHDAQKPKIMQPNEATVLHQIAHQQRSHSATAAVKLWIRFVQSGAAKSEAQLQQRGFSKDWRDLTRDEHAAAAALGWDEITWDAGEVPPRCIDVVLDCVWSWSELDIHLMRAAETLGYDAEIWDFQYEPHLRHAGQQAEKREQATTGAEAVGEMQMPFTPVEWDEVKPLRCYVPHSKSASAEARAAGQSTDATNSCRIIMHCSERMRAHVDEQALLELSKSPQDVVRRHVVVGRIVDRSHPCVMCAGDKPVYGGFAKEDIAPYTVLGYYGGLTQTVKLVDGPPDLSGYAFELRSTQQWQGGDGWLEIDGERGTNELAMINDYRSDVSEQALLQDALQQRSPNAEAVEVCLDGDALPSVVFVSSKAIAKHAEITIDYGAEYWRGFHEREKKSREGGQT